MGEYMEQLSNFVLQVDMSDKWVWKLHSIHSYTVRSAYYYLTTVDINITEDFNQFL